MKYRSLPTRSKTRRRRGGRTRLFVLGAACLTPLAATSPALAAGAGLTSCMKRFVNRLAATIEHGHGDIHTDRGDHGRGSGLTGLDRGRRPSRLKISHRHAM